MFTNLIVALEWTNNIIKDFFLTVVLQHLIALHIENIRSLTSVV